MNILVRRTTIWAITAFFGCVSLLGPGWHCVFGHHYHGECQGASSCAHRAAEYSPSEHRPADTSIAGCRTGCCTPKRIAAESNPASDKSNIDGEPSIGSVAAPGHHCPLCQFFGTAQWAPSFAPTELVLVATELLIPAAASRDREAPRLYLSRAPPRGSAHC